MSISAAAMPMRRPISVEPVKASLLKPFVVQHVFAGF